MANETSKTVVAPAKLAAVARKLGLPVDQHSFGFQVNAGADRRVYISKKGTDVHLSGFTHPHGTPFEEDKRPTNLVHQRLLFVGDELSILKKFFRILKEGVVEKQGPQLTAARNGRSRAAVPVPTADEIAAAVAMACEEPEPTNS